MVGRSPLSPCGEALHPQHLTHAWGDFGLERWLNVAVSPHWGASVGGQTR